MRVLLVTFVAVCAIALAQTAEPPPWAETAAGDEVGPTVTLRLIDPHVYRQGEVIQAEVSSDVPVREPGPDPPSERWIFTGLLLDPSSGCGTVERPCWGRLASGVNGIDQTLELGRRPEPLPLVLNTRLSSLAPGRYRVALLMTKHRLTPDSGRSLVYGVSSGEQPEHAVSNTVEFEVSRAPGEWVKATVADSQSILRAQERGSRGESETRRLAAERLRFLDQPESWRASLEALPEMENVLLRGLEESSQPEGVCGLMRTEISSPGQSVSPQYLAVAARVCGRAEGIQALPVAGYNRRLEPMAATLAANLSRKRTDVKSDALITLLSYVRQLRFGDEPDAEPAWTPAVRREFIRSFAGNVSRQSYLLDLASMSIGSPDLLPLFESVMDAWKPGDYYEAPRTALVGVYRVEPARAERRVLAELAKPRTWLDLPQLDLLPASAAPPMDSVLIEALERDLGPGGWNRQLSMAAIAKYATPGALPRVRAIYESLDDPCQPELVAYFVRVDSSYAGRIFHSHPWDVQAAAPPCAVRYFDVTPRLAMAPVLEEYLAAYLMHYQVPVKQTAARSLGRYGSTAALKPLWDAFRYFRDYWNGKERELLMNVEGIPLEVELRNAIARGSNWLVTEAGLKTIEALCVSGRCIDETRNDLDYWKRPLRIDLRDGQRDVEGSVAHYFRLPTLQAVKNKLSQFPRGTRFVLDARGPSARRAAPDIREFAQQRGLLILEAGTAPGRQSGDTAPVYP